MHVGGATRGFVPHPVSKQLPPAAQRTGLFGKVIVTLVARQHAHPLRGVDPVERSQHDSVRPGAGQHTVVEAYGVRDDPGVQVLLQAKRHAKHRVLVAHRVLALRHRNAPELRAFQPVLLHVLALDDPEEPVGAPEAVRRRVVVERVVEVLHQSVVAGDAVDIPGKAEHDVRSTGVDCVQGIDDARHRPRAARGELPCPGHAESELLAQRHRVVGMQKEGRYRDAVDVRLFEARALERLSSRLGQKGEQGSVATLDVERLSVADYADISRDHGVR